MAWRRWILRVVSGIGAGALASAFVVMQAPDVALYNHSPSMPIGIYWRTEGDAALGAIVTVRARDVAPEMAAARRFGEDGHRFLKRIAAVEGDHVCVSGRELRVNGALAAVTPDPVVNDAVPTWRGCRRLEVGEILLLGESADSFDGRYWGPISERLIEGVWRKL